MNLTVTKIIEKDEDRVLLEGTDYKGRRKTFHLMRTNPGVDELVRLVEAGEEVRVTT